MQQPLDRRAAGRSVPLHYVSYRATGSALSNVQALKDTIAWLVNDEERVVYEKSTSYHGSELHLITAHVTNKRAALRALAALGKKNLKRLEVEWPQRTDEANVLYFRLEMSDATHKTATLVEPGLGPTIKGQAKLALYPGKQLEDEWSATLQAAMALVEEEE
ncbi:MAG: hypothetical protein DWC07_06975 [Candidatus Poseidoniales archaeon]|nr:MAG: hypothetical protein DWC07_06975 [Candidatus Poseidoniales archaeon]